MSMAGLRVNLNECHMEAVSNESASIFSEFTCGNPSIDKYFHDDVMTDAKNVCYVFRNQKNGDIIGLAALCCSGINLDDHDLVELIPAVKIDYFAVSEKYQDIDVSNSNNPDDKYYISDAFLCLLIQEIRRIAEAYIGATHIILYSVPDAIHFYERNLFGDFERYMKPEQYHYLDGCKPMYMAL